MITEYCSLGDLLNFLRLKAETFANFVLNVPDVEESSIDYKNVCSQKQFIRRYIFKCAEKYLLCDVHVDSITQLNLPNSDSGISSSASSSYLEMRPCLLPNTDLSQGTLSIRAEMMQLLRALFCLLP